MLRSITLALAARCPETGQLGHGFITSDPPDRALTFQANIRVGQSLQIHRPQKLLNRRLLAILARDLTSEEALQHTKAGIEEPEKRQILLMSADGKAAAKTGDDVEALSGHGKSGDYCTANFAIMGFGLPDLSILTSAHQTFSTETEPLTLLADRILASLSSLEEHLAGPGLPLTAAGLHILAEDPYPLIDLRADMSERPATRLKEIYEDYMAEDILEDALLPTAENPHGIPPTGWGDTKRFAIRHWREAQRRWKRRRSAGQTPPEA